jgi:uncharacterized membrane protein
VDVIASVTPEFSGRVRRAGLVRVAALSPAVVFVFLSTLLGNLMLAATPPLRGPDETAHFLRAYGLSMGDLVPTTLDQEGRKGFYLPARVHRGFDYFETVRDAEKPPGFGFADVFRNYAAERSPGGDDPPVFVRYGGSEGYSPAAYLPQAAAALLARAAGLDFLGTLYLMRHAGLTAMTAVLAYAIALAGPLGWAFLGIAMLPSALYGRAVINADAAALAYAMVAAALFLRTRAGRPVRPVGHAVWLALCALSKPPNLAFLLLAPLTGRGRPLVRGLVKALVVLPGLFAAILWSLASSADVAAWRLAVLTGVDPVQFEPVWKLGFMLEHPLAFPAALWGTLSPANAKELWVQLIGVLGMFDTVLHWWVYPALSALLIPSFFVRLELGARARHGARVAGAAALAYCLAVFAILYLVWTPVDAPMIMGVQGRYFVPALPLLAIVTAALARWRGDEQLAAWTATAGAILAGCASLEAILRTDWNF